MTVKELIEILKLQDENSVVIVEEYAGGFAEANTAWAKAMGNDRVAFLSAKG